MIPMESLHSAVNGVPDVHAYRPAIQFLLAYIDPESGALLLQVLIAGFIGFLASFRKAIIALAAQLLARKKPKSTHVH